MKNKIFWCSTCQNHNTIEGSHSYSLWIIFDHLGFINMHLKSKYTGVLAFCLHLNAVVVAGNQTYTLELSSTPQPLSCYSGYGLCHLTLLFKRDTHLFFICWIQNEQHSRRSFCNNKISSAISASSNAVCAPSDVIC